MAFLRKKEDKRNIIPMGRPMVEKDYSAETLAKDIAKGEGMDPDKVDIIADGQDIQPDDAIGTAKDITIMPKQKGGL